MLTTLSILSPAQGQLYPNKRMADAEPEPPVQTHEPALSHFAKLLDFVHLTFGTPADRAIRPGM